MKPQIVVGVLEQKSPYGVKRGWRLVAAVYNMARYNVFSGEHEQSFAEKYMVDWKGDYPSKEEAEAYLLDFVHRQRRRGRVEIQL